jgi:CBS domain containing-hemolysin-like protein
VESIIIILVCLAGSAFFSGSETALLRVRQSELADDVHAGPADSAIRDLLRSTSRLLVTILLGNNLVNILAVAVASALAVATLGPELGVVVSTAVMTLLVLFFCEVMPKAIAAAHPHGVARLVALPLYLVHQLLRPVHRAFAVVVDPLVRRIAGRADGSDSAEDVLRLVSRTRLEGGDTGALSIIGATAAAANRTVEEIMQDRTQIFAFSVETAPRELLDSMLDERYTRTPIYEGTIDNILGIVHFKDLVKLVRVGGSDLREVLKPHLRVPERKAILPLLAEMQRSFSHLAVVKDEHGITQGLLTTEDILEELVGEIRDEFDQEELSSIGRLEDGAFDALGRVKVLDFNRATGWDVHAEPGDTLSGLVFNELGRPPQHGDRVRIPGFEVEVMQVSGTRIARVRVRRCEEAETAPGEQPRP